MKTLCEQLNETIEAKKLERIKSAWDYEQDLKKLAKSIREGLDDIEGVWTHFDGQWNSEDRKMANEICDETIAELKKGKALFNDAWINTVPDDE